MRGVLVDESHDAYDVTDSLDVVSCRQSLDVTLLKDRLAVKQKGKRQTTALQRKIDAQVAVAGRFKRSLFRLGCIILLHDDMLCIAQTVLSQDVRPSVCHTPVLCQNS